MCFSRPIVLRATLLCALLVACSKSTDDRVTNQQLVQVATPTVVLIFVDTLRADHLGTYGYSKNTSPNIDRLANEAAVFENAIAQATWTLPSFLSVFTSRYVPALVDMKYGKRYFLPLPAEVPVLTEYFHEQGYATAGFVAVRFLGREFGFHRGFDVYDDSGESAVKIVKRAISWLKTTTNLRKFLFVHLYDVHGDFRPPKPYDEMFVQKIDLKTAIDAPPYSQHDHSFDHIPKYQTLKGHRNLSYYVAQYDGEIRHVDTQLGKLFEALRSQGLYDNSLILLSADHGESLTEYRYYLDHGVPTDQVLKVPLILKLPSTLRLKGRFSGQVQLIDILPTLLELLKVAPKMPLQGTSLLGVVRGELTETSPYAYATEGIMDQWVIRTNHWKYVRRVPGSRELQVWRTCPDSDLADRKAVVEELFDLKEDANEQDNLATQNPQMRGKLAADLDVWITDQARRRTGQSTSPVQLDAETKKQLRALGYTSP